MKEGRRRIQKKIIRSRREGKEKENERIMIKADDEEREKDSERGGREM